MIIASQLGIQCAYSLRTDINPYVFIYAYEFTLQWIVGFCGAAPALPPARV